MNQHLQQVVSFIQQNDSLTVDEKNALLKSLKDANKELEINVFKLDRTEKVKKTTAILLEETIEELEQKRKAVEAQNKELEIEASLEKVRSCSLAMNTSSELNEVVIVLFERLKELNIPVASASINVYIDGSKDMDVFVCGQHEKGLVITNYLLPWFEHPISEDLYNARINGQDFFTGRYFKEQKDSFYEYLFDNGVPKELPADIKGMILKSQHYSVSMIPVKNAMIVINDFENKPLPEHDINLLKRFAKVFEQTYTRFLDLQKAEAQAKESQIQLALERVRARTMAMQKSDELADAAAVLFQQVKNLGIETYTSGFNIWDEQHNILVSWMANPLGIINPPFIMPANEYGQHKRFYEAWKNNIVFTEDDLTGEKIKDHYKYLRSFPLLETAFAKAEQAGIKTPDRQVHNAVFFSHGYVLFVTLEPKPEFRELFKRFGQVFQQTYTRFLDLQKAEAQAREAQIEAALEKVRSRSLAMHHSDEIKEVVKTVVEKITELSIEMNGGVSLVTFSPESKDLTHWIWIPEQFAEPFNAYLPYFDNLMFHDCHGARKDGVELIGKVYSGKIKDDYFNHIFQYSGFKNAPEDLKVWVMQQPYFGFSYAIQQHSGIFLNDYTGKYFSKETNDILVRFSKVFEQAYVRFLDLQKAEAQSRESQIQLALERVRARTMAMQHSDELLDASTLLFQQIESLGAPVWNCSFNIWTEDKKEAVAWNGTKDGFGRPFNTPSSEDVFLDFYNASQRGDELYIKEIGGKELELHYDYLSTLPGVGATLAELKEAGIVLPTFQVFNIAYFAQGYLMFITYDPVPEFADIFKRFAKVFDQTYTRFLDLQKAEAQAREAQVEVALERVRARTMAMHRSDELAETASALFKQIKDLGFEMWSCGFCIWKPEDIIEGWFGADAGGLLPPLMIPYKEEPTHRDIYEASLKGNTVHEAVWQGKALEEHYAFLKTIPSVKTAIEQMEGAGLSLPDKQCYYVGFFKHGYLLLITKEIKADALDLCKRFAAVFDLTYTRFLDLQKAEAQAREAQIETALERVRSRTMGMQKSEELKEIINVVYEQLVHLKIPVEHAGFIMDYKERDDMLIWLADQHAVPSQIIIPYFDSPHWNSFKEAKEKGLNFFVNHHSFEGKNKFYTDLFKLFPVPDEAKEYYFRCPGLAISTVLLDNIGLYIENFSGNPYTDEENNVLMRFGKVFQQTYTRFLDLKKAEAQARESQVQLALERVRARTMAMQHSDELADASFVLDTQVRSLGIKTRGCAFNIYGDGESLEWFSSGQGSLPMYKTPREKLFLRYFEKGISGTPLYIEEFAGEACAAHYEYLCTIPIMGDALRAMIAAGGSFPTRQIDHVTYHKYGYLLFITLEPEPEAHEIFIRFAKVFEQTYTRFLDLKKAEAQAKEAQIESALERVRSRTLAMQKSDELAETAAVLFQQLIALGIEPNRLYISIIKGENGDTEFWITDEDGTKVSTAFAANMNNNITFFKMYEGWKQQEKSLVIDMHGEELQNYFRHLTSLGVPFKGGLEQKRRVQDIAYFSKGFIGMASPDEQPAETLQLLERFAAVFNLTFTRFNDLKMAEAHAIQAEHDLIEIKTARKKAEDTLTELQATQKQLIQSEKMASLGELTAGIAHEIQNPLNFVNNFSEVSNELIDEMKAELAVGNLHLALELANDISQNLEKINHHGKRADGIVKGMLQHSQSSGTIKEPTDINALADEYLRLAYHGLRAKDKLFNATIKTDFDKTIGQINIIPQDIGRVVLNVLTNAFYAVNEKAASYKLVAASYEPQVKVGTKKLADRVEVRIEDNGDGIPQNNIDKIFQPFFTTKPTGQGTGLGLSLTYDIVKAHGGELKVETKEGEGTIFIIHLPKNN